MNDVCESHEKAALLFLPLSTRMSLSGIRPADQQILCSVSGAEPCEVCCLSESQK